MKKNILIISAAFYPEQSPRSFRATELAKEFSRLGHSVTVFTYPDEKHEEFASETGITFDYLVNGKKKYSELKGSGLYILFQRLKRRLLHLFFDYPNIQHYFTVRQKIKKTQHKFDLLISIAVPHPVHWGVSSVWEKKNSKKIADTWVADCGDPFMYGVHDTFSKMYYFHYFENQFLKYADYVTVPFEEMKDLFNQKYREKFRVIPQGFKIEKTVLPEYKPYDVPTFIYSGTVMPGFRDPFSLIDFLNDENYEFKFIIFTRQKHLFSKYEALLGKKIFIRDYVPRESLLKELARADFLINVNTDSVDGKIKAIPSKLIDYTISGRPVLSYEQNKLPIKAISEFMNGNYSQAFDGISLDRYRIENVAEQFLQLIS